MVRTGLTWEKGSEDLTVEEPENRIKGNLFKTISSSGIFQGLDSFELQNLEVAEKTSRLEEGKQKIPEQIKEQGIIIPLKKAEKHLLKTRGSRLYEDEGIYPAWKSGILHITNKRIFLLGDNQEMLFKTSFDQVHNLKIEKKDFLTAMMIRPLEIYLFTLALKNGDLIKLATDRDKKILKTIGFGTGERFSSEDKAKVLLKGGEGIIFKTQGSKLEESGVYPVWKQGELFITNQRIFLLEENKILFETDLEKIKAIGIKEKRDLADFPWDKPVKELYLKFKKKLIKLRSGRCKKFKELVINQLKEKGLSFEDKGIIKAKRRELTPEEKKKIILMQQIGHIKRGGA